MEQKNPYLQVKNLHNEIVAEIKQMMIDHNKAVVDLAGSQAPHAFIIGVPDFDWDMDYVEAEVMSVILEDGKIKFDINWDIDSDEYLDEHPNENDDISDLYSVVDSDDFGKLLPCAGISSVYGAVWEYIEYGYKGDNDEDIQ
jgi:hypothetical protein